MKRPPLPYLLVLPLLVVLVFGNCGGGVRGMLGNLSSPRQQQLRALLVLRLQQRAVARQHVRGPARQEAYRRIEQNTDARMDSLIPASSADKFRNRRNKVDRQLLRLPAAAPPSHGVN